MRVLSINRQMKVDIQIAKLGESLPINRRMEVDRQRGKEGGSPLRSPDGRVVVNREGNRARVLSINRREK